MYISKYNPFYGGQYIYIGATKLTLFIKVEVLASTYIKNKPFGQNTLNDIIISSTRSIVKRK